MSFKNYEQEAENIALKQRIAELELHNNIALKLALDKITELEARLKTADYLIVELEGHEGAEELEAECKRLFGLLDDISTAGDVFKPEINTYFKCVNDKCEKRDGLFYSDGYEILPKEVIE